MKPATIPARFLPAEEIIKQKKSLLNKVNSCVSKKLTATELFMKIAGCGYETVTTDYDPDCFGFAPDELAVFPDNTVGMCVGISHNATEPKVWFVSNHNAHGIIYWPDANSPEKFGQAGFARIQKAG